MGWLYPTQRPVPMNEMDEWTARLYHPLFLRFGVKLYPFAPGCGLKSPEPFGQIPDEPGPVQGTPVGTAQMPFQQSGDEEWLAWGSDKPTAHIAGCQYQSCLLYTS